MRQNLKIAATFVLAVVMSLSFGEASVLAEGAETAANIQAEQTDDVKIVKSGKSGDLDWVIDANGKLTISGSGDYDRNGKIDGNFSVPEWCESYDNITTAVVNVKNITNTKNMFAGCVNLTSVDVSGLDTGNVTNMDEMFKNCKSLISLNISGLHTENVTTMFGMFKGCSGLTDVDVSGFDTGKVTDMSEMFKGCSSLTSLNISGFDTKNVTDMSYMFRECSSLVDVNVSKFNTENVTDMQAMFYGCSRLKSVDVSKFNTDSVEYMGQMFTGCSSLSELDMSAFDMSSISDLEDDFNRIFSGCKSLNIVKMPKEVVYPIDLPQTDGFVWKDENDKVCTEVAEGLTTPMKYTRYGTTPTPTPDEPKPTPDEPKPTPDNPKPSPDEPKPTPDEPKPTPDVPKPTPDNPTPDSPLPSGTKVATYNGDTFYKGDDGELRCYDRDGKLVTDEFKCDGTYTYYMQADGTPMKDRLTYHPDGEHIIYLDKEGHEVFNNFQYCPSVGYTCYFDSQGYLYKDQITFVGNRVYYLNANGKMEDSGWFQFANGRDYGCANSNGTLVTTGFSYDPYGRVVFYHWNGMVARGLISDGVYYYNMDADDGHYLGQFPVR